MMKLMMNETYRRLIDFFSLIHYSFLFFFWMCLVPNKMRKWALLYYFLLNLFPFFFRYFIFFPNFDYVHFLSKQTDLKALVVVF